MHVKPDRQRLPKCQRLDAEQLRVLLYEREDQLETSEISTHVETCATCQGRLSELVSADAMESEALMWLGSSADSASHLWPQPVAEHSVAHTVDRDIDSESQLDAVLLDRPSHPEMLGRLGRYEIERRIGAGGMGVVYKAIDTELHRPVALKVLAPHLARSGAARQRFSRESRAAAAVVHEHVVAIHNVDSASPYPYLVMQYVAGESLQARVERHGPLDPEQILRIGIQAAWGLSAAHQQGIIHRDIKPANILLEEGVDRLLITDFGLARIVDDASLTHTGVVAGTPSYMSPEQASGDEVDQRTDLFSLGSVLYFAATGHPPFRAERAMGVLHRICHSPHRPVWQVNATIPMSLSHVIDRLLAKRPAKRFAQANAVAESLSHILQHLQQRPTGLQAWFGPARSSLSRSWHQSRGSRIGLTLLAVAFFGYTLLAAWTWLPVISPPTNSPTVNESSLSGSSQPLSSASSLAEPLSPDVIAAVSDAPEFERSVQSLSAALDQLEATPPFINPAANSAFERELDALRQALDQFDPTLQPSL